MLPAILSTDRSIMTSATMASPYIPGAQVISTNKSYDEKCSSSNIINNPVIADNSLTSYLAVVRDNFQAPAAAAAAERLNAISSAAHRSTPVRTSLMTRKRAEDVENEIDIFSAEKYFGGSGIAAPSSDPVDTAASDDKLDAAKSSSIRKLGVQPPTSMIASAAAVVLPKSRLSKQTATGTVNRVCCGSETSSGNSRSGFLRDRGHRRHVGSAEVDGGCGKVFHRGGLGFWCSSCSRKSSVKVNKLPSSACSSTASTINNTSTTTACAAANNDFFYEQNHDWSSPASWRIGAAPSPVEGPWPWAPQVSSLSPAASSSSMERRELPPPQQLLGTSHRRSAVVAAALAEVSKVEDDARSESSSELFEIESVSFGRAEGAGSTYEPSEASIDWSVVTASAAAVSVASDRSGELGGKGTGAMRRSAGMQGRKSSTVGILGCASHKAVEVVNAAETVPRRAAGGGCEIKVGAAAAEAAGEAESSILPVVARYHVELEVGGGSGRIVAGRSSRTSWESFRAHRSPPSILMNTF